MIIILAITALLLLAVAGVMLLKKKPHSKTRTTGGSFADGRQPTAKRAIPPGADISSGDVSTESSDDDGDAGGVEDVRGSNRRQRGGMLSLPGAGRLHQRRLRRSADTADRDDDDDDAEGGSKTKLSRLQKKKKEKERAREEREQARMALYDSRRAAQEAEERGQRDRERREQEEQERLLAEEAALQELREEKKRQEDDEYRKWVGAIDVEESGEIGDEGRRRHDSLVKFLTDTARNMDVRRQKQPAADGSAEGDGGINNIMVLNDVARDHGVAVEVLVQVIEKLLKDGTVSGVFDDRGKFVMVSEHHYRRVAEFIKLRGRVSVKELVRECNRVILSQ